jgi:hypothetical protein
VNVEDSTESVLDSLFVTVRVRTLVYEDGRLREAVADAAGVDFSPRFFFASRIRLEPMPPQSTLLDRMVTMRARDGFTDRLEERGFVRVRSTSHRSLAVGETEAELYRFDARCRTGELTVGAVGWTAVWSDDEGYLFAGGAYPTTVLGGASDGEVASTLESLFTPDEFRTELLALIRATR